MTKVKREIKNKIRIKNCDNLFIFKFSTSKKWYVKFYVGRNITSHGMFEQSLRTTDKETAKRFAKELWFKTKSENNLSVFKTINNEYFAYPSKSSIKRLDDAYNFSKKLQIPIFISGGKTIDNIDSEAEILVKNYFENLKNMEIILETKSINSYDTGYYVNRYLKENNLEKNIILFTDVYHFKRMLGVLEKNNITVFFSKNSIVIKKIKYYDFLPHYKNYGQMNKIRYSYFALINYIFLNKMKVNALFY